MYTSGPIIGTWVINIHGLTDTPTLLVLTNIQVGIYIYAIISEEMKWLVLYATILHCKAKLGRGQLGRILLGIIPLAQDRSRDLLSSSPARYHCSTDAPSRLKKKNLSFVCVCVCVCRVNEKKNYSSSEMLQCEWNDSKIF